MLISAFGEPATRIDNKAMKFGSSPKVERVLNRATSLTAKMQIYDGTLNS